MRPLSSINTAFIFAAICTPVLHAEVAPFLASEAFERGDYGAYPFSTYMTTDLISPHVNVLRSDVLCGADGLLTMLNPRGYAVEHAAPVILDAAGELIWTSVAYEQTYGLTVQRYNGSSYLTFWSGDDRVRGHGEGYYYMLDETYKTAFKVGAGHGRAADLHEFRITDDGTALLTIYEVVPADLRAVNATAGADGWIWDCLIQELHLATQEVLFEWRASEHWDVTASFHDLGPDGGADAPWDYFHINSIDKDDRGNYLVSSRYMHALTYIDGRTGDTLWVLGGARNMFADLSGGNATNFRYQHHARWHDDHTTITLFDNGAEAWHYVSPVSRGLSLAVDLDAMTVAVRQEYVDPGRTLSQSQGSMQLLPSGHVLVGYGFNGAFTEFAANGTALCDVHFQAGASVETGDAQSYRVLKHAWTGRPTTKPAAKLVGDRVFVSWNGATEVREWVLEGADAGEVDERDWTVVQRVDRRGFETTLESDGDGWPFLRLVALDDEGAVLGRSEVLDVDYEKVGLIGG